MPVKKLFEANCVRNFRNPLFAKLLLFEILGHFQKLFWAKILGVRNFRVFEILGHLPYFKVLSAVVVSSALSNKCMCCIFYCFTQYLLTHLLVSKLSCKSWNSSKMHAHFFHTFSISVEPLLGIVLGSSRGTWLLHRVRSLKRKKNLNILT